MKEQSIQTTLIAALFLVTLGCTRESKGVVSAPPAVPIAKQSLIYAGSKLISKVMLDGVPIPFDSASGEPYVSEITPGTHLVSWMVGDQKITVKFAVTSSTPIVVSLLRKSPYFEVDEGSVRVDRTLVSGKSHPDLELDSWQTPAAPFVVAGGSDWKIRSNKWYSKVEVKMPPSGAMKMLVRTAGWYLRGVDESYGTVSFERRNTLEALRKSGWKKVPGIGFPTYFRKTRAGQFWSASVIQIRDQDGLLCRFQGEDAPPKSLEDRLSRTISLITK